MSGRHAVTFGRHEGPTWWDEWGVVVWAAIGSGAVVLAVTIVFLIFAMRTGTTA